MTLPFAFLAAGLALTPAQERPPAVVQHGAGLPRALANDNRTPAGRLAGDTLVLRLVVQRAVWHLDRDTDPGIQMLAFAQEGAPPLIPGPLVRVPTGTIIDASLRNTLERDTLIVHGLARPGSGDSIVVPPGATAGVRFAAESAGTYFYWGTTTRSSLRQRFGEDSNLSGAFVVDARDASRPAGDRIFVLTEHGDSAAGLDGLRAPLWTAINGKSWPHTERLTYPLGDSIQWRVINASASPHPMHLHGAYFRVDAKGSPAADTSYSPQTRRMVVTERLLPGQAMRMTWSPERPGGWLFHCHALTHVAPHLPVTSGTASAHAHAADPDQHTLNGMGGLVLAVSIPPPAGYVAAPAAPRRRLRLLVHSDSGPGDRARRFGYVLQTGEQMPRADSLQLPGPTLILTRGEPTAIEVINRTPEPTAVHWHGIELESFFDGVVGVGGLPERPTPAIRPGGRFEAHITARRAGTFMYHTHFSEIRQQYGGLVGALVVLEPGERWDPERDLVFVIGDARDRKNNVINGSRSPVPVDLHTGTTYRLRLMNIAVVRPGTRVQLMRDGRPVTWRAVAKDGWTLDSAQATPRPSVQPLASGETIDFEFTPDRAGDLTLELRAPTNLLFVAAPIRVR